MAKKKNKFELEPGDIINMEMKRGSSPFSKAFKAVSDAVQGPFGHSAIYIGNGKVVESYSKTGVQVNNVKKATRGRSFVVLRPNVSKKKKRKAVSFAKEQVGKPYNAMAVMWTGLNRILPQKLTEKINEGRVRVPNGAQAFMCSELVGASYKSAGVDLSQKTPTPFDLSVSKKVKLVKKRLTRGFKNYMPSINNLMSPYANRFNDKSLSKTAASEFYNELQKIAENQEYEPDVPAEFQDERDENEKKQEVDQDAKRNLIRLRKEMRNENKRKKMALKRMQKPMSRLKNVDDPHILDEEDVEKENKMAEKVASFFFSP